MITVYHLATSRSERIVWLLEELELPYTMEWFDRGPDRLAPDALKGPSPTGKAPAIRDGDVVMAESGAIVSYVLARHGGGGLLPAPTDTDFPAYQFWLHASEGSLGANLLREMAITRVMPEASAHPDLARIRHNVRDGLALVEHTLGRSPFIAGARFTGADIMMPFWFTTAARFIPLDLAPYPNIRAYVARIGDRPAYRRAMAVAGPDVGGASPGAAS